MRMIAGIMKPTGGEIRYDGIEIGTMGEKYRDIFGYLPQEFGFYPGFSVQDYLEYMAALKGIGKRERKDTGTSGIGITYGCQKEENQQIIRRNETPCGNRTGIVE